eukprot:6179967-Pleurochrysis_carterae.AAC.1
MIEEQQRRAESDALRKSSCADGDAEGRFAAQCERERLTLTHALALFNEGQQTLAVRILEERIAALETIGASAKQVP